MSHDQKPVTLPENYYSTWAQSSSALSDVTGGSDVKTYSGQGGSSRVTASGFTDTTIRPSKQRVVREMESLINDELDDLRFRRRRSDVGITSNHESNQSRNRDHTDGKGHDEISDKVSEVSLAGSKKREIENIKRNRAEQETQWENEHAERYVTMKDFVEFTRSMSSVHPKESASQMEPSTFKSVMTTRDQTSSKLTGILEMESDIEGTVIGGYDMSAKEKLREVEAFSSMPSVRGLPRVYVNERLNFLSHIHTALFRFVTDDEGRYPSPKCLDVLIDSRKTWGNDPETTLLIVVLDRTIDYRSSIVIANPFRLPILEPTMELTSQKMFMCLDQLHREFEIEYFNTVKTMTVPDFHGKYRSRNHGHSSSGRRRSSGAMTQSSSSSGKSSKGSSRRGSMVEEGSFLSRISRK